MDKPSSSSSSSKLSWLWVIEALASYNQFPLPTLQDLIDSAPVSHEDFSEDTKEFIALRCLEELSSSSSTLNSSRIPIDSSLTSQHVLIQILDKVASSSNLNNLNTFGAEFLKWDVNPFIMHKRASKMKCHLEKMKDSILNGTLQLPDKLKERSGLFKMNRANMACANQGKRDDRSVKGNGNSTLKDGNKASKKSLPGNSRLCSKRTRVDLADNEVCIIKYDEFLTSTEKTKCNASTDFDSNKEKQVSQLGKEVSEIQISKNVGQICDESLEDIHTRCTTSNLCQSSGQHKVIHGESDIPFNTTLRPQHTCEGETNDGKANNNQHMTNQSQPQQKKRNVASSNVSQKRVASDKGVVDTVSGAELSTDSDMYHNEKIALTAKKNELLLRSRHAFGQPQQKKRNVASSNVSQKRVASDKGVVDTLSGAELSSDSDMYHNEKIALTAKKNELPRSRHAFGQPEQKKPNVASSNVSQKRVGSDKDVVDTVSEAELSSDSDMHHNEEIAFKAKKDEFCSGMTESTGKNVCIKCNEVGQLLVCKASTCSLMMHKNCLGDSAQLDANGNFLCPFCEYSPTISEYLEAKTSASLAKKQLAIFKTMGIRN